MPPAVYDSVLCMATDISGMEYAFTKNYLTDMESNTNFLLKLKGKKMFSGKNISCKCVVCGVYCVGGQL